MDYDAVLAQVVTLLQQERRVAYRVLKRRFQLDDETLDDLKDDLIYAKKLAVDEEGRVLVWTGGTSRVPSTAASVPLPATPGVSPAPGEASPVIPPTPDAERRQLTVMFCDLVDSTKLSSQLDPEDWRDVVRAYQRVCTEVIQRYDGHIAQLLGDGLLVYFGYPQAHEDDAQRAVRAGLGMLGILGDLNTRLQHAQGVQLALRVGIHTGVVVVGEMGGEGRQEQLALGEVPNVAARIQGLAEPNTLLISTDTYRLIQGYFESQALGAQALRGVAEPVHVYRVLQESGARGRLDVAVTRGLTPLVGRELEVALLLERWEQVKAGHGHIVLLSGEGGIGKSRLVQTLKEHVANEPHMQWECRSAEYYQNTALFPLTDLFHRLLRFQAEETPDKQLGKLEQMLRQYRLPLEESVPLFAPLLSLSLPESRYAPLNVSPQRQRRKTLETIVAILQELAEYHPVLFIVEDLHWTDPTTLELLNLLIDQTPTASLLVLLTCRPTFQPSWTHRSYLNEITVHRLARHQIERMTDEVAGGRPLPVQVLTQIVEKTDGVPLFVEEITKSLLESGQLRAVDGHYELIGSLSTFTIPATLHDSLMARLDRLVTAKGIAQLAAVIGRQFAYALLQAVSQLDEVTLQRELGRLIEAELVYQRGVPPQATYIFKHALIQDAAYESLLKSTRQQYHQRIAQVLEAQFPETIEGQPELLAHHYTEAGLLAQSVAYWQRAGERVLQRSANLEAISHLTRGLEVLSTLPESHERVQQELGLQNTLGPALAVTKGQQAPETERTYARACELARQVGDTPQLFLGLWGFWYAQMAGGKLQRARALGEEFLGLARQQPDPLFLLHGHRMVGNIALWQGELVEAQAHVQEGLTHYDPEQHRAHAVHYSQDSGVSCSVMRALILWMLGYPDQARQGMEETLVLARGLGHPFTLAQMLFWSALLYQLRREPQVALAQVEEALALCTEQGFGLYLTFGMVLRGWALAAQGQWAEGIAQIREGFAAFRATGAGVFWPWFLALLADACSQAGQIDEGRRASEEALEALQTHEDRIYEAEVYRLKGVLLQGAAAHQKEAEEHLQQALNIARRQQAKSLELRAAMSLARLWQRQEKCSEAYQLLAEIYGWFTEGFDTADLQEAKALLEALASPDAG